MNWRLKNLLVITLCVASGEMYGQSELERRNSVWGKLDLEQVSPNKFSPGEPIVIQYRAYDAKDASIALYNNERRMIRLYDDLYPGVGQIKIREELMPGIYIYALVINGRLVEKRKFEIIGSVANN